MELQSCAALGLLYSLSVVLEDGLWARVVVVGTAGLLGYRAAGLLGCGDAEIQAFGNLGLGAEAAGLQGCRNGHWDAGLPVCLVVGLLGHRAGEV